jgi:putative aldouronate transport system permease protein
MVLPAFLSVVVFSVIPISGVIISFMDYKLGGGLFNGQWVGLKHFADMFSDKLFLRALRNTVVISFLDMVFCFPAPIILALLFNEAPFKRFKRLAQTGSYLPHFLSYVVVAAFWKIILDNKGIVNNFLLSAGIVNAPVEFWTTPKYYWPLTVIVSLWKNAGWGAIIYFAAITNVSAEVYEAAIVDGAGRFRRVFSILLPAIMGTIVVMGIMRLAGLFNASFDQSYLLGNVFNRDVSYVISYYTIELGLRRMNFSYSTAINLFQSTASLILLIAANTYAKRKSDASIF